MQCYFEDQYQGKHPTLTEIDQLVHEKCLTEKSLIKTCIAQEALTKDTSKV